MIRSDKKLKELKLIMAKENAAAIAEAIRFLRSEQPFDGAIEQLVSYYSRSNNTLLKKQITEFMNDIKDLSVRNEIVREIKKENSSDTIRMLISSCWQSGLDYSDYALDFAAIFMETDDYMTALECFTVIEISASNMTSGKKKILLEKISSESVSGPDEKSPLLRELISVLR